VIGFYGTEDERMLVLFDNGGSRRYLPKQTFAGFDHAGSLQAVPVGGLQSSTLMSDQVPTRCEQILAIALGRGRGGVRSDRRQLPNRRKGSERRKRSEDALGQERRTGVDRRHAGRRLSDTQE
jgi:hypothetical protein